MSYENRSLIGELMPYKGGKDDKISMDMFRKEEITLPIFFTLNAGYNAIRTTRLDQIIINEISNANFERLGSIRPGYTAATAAYTSLTTYNAPAQPTVGYLRTACVHMHLKGMCDVILDARTTTNISNCASPASRIEYVGVAEIDMKVSHLQSAPPFKIDYLGMRKYTSGQYAYLACRVLSSTFTFFSTETIPLEYIPVAGYTNKLTTEMENLAPPGGTFIAGFKVADEHTLFFKLIGGWVSGNGVILEYTDENKNLTYFKDVGEWGSPVTPLVGGWTGSRFGAQQLLVPEIPTTVIPTPPYDERKFMSDNSFANTTLVYSDDDIKLSVDDDKEILCAHIDGTRLYGAISASRNISSIEQVTHEPGYYSFILKCYTNSYITNIIYIYVAIRKLSAFSGGYIHDKDDYHMFIAEIDNESFSTQTKPRDKNGVKPYNDGDYNSGNGGAVVFPPQGTRTFKHKYFAGTKDILIASSNNDIYNHWYGGYGVAVFNGGWYDQSLLVAYYDDIPIVLPSIIIPNFFNSQINAFQLGHGFLIVDGTNYDSEFGAGLNDYQIHPNIQNNDDFLEITDPLNSSFCYFQQLNIGEGNIISSLPKHIKEVVGYDMGQYYLGWGYNFFTINEIGYCQKGKTLYLAVEDFKLMPNPTEVVLDGYDLYYNTGQFIFASTNDRTDVYTLSKDGGIQLSTTFRGTMVCKPNTYKGDIYVITHTSINFLINKVSRDGAEAIYIMDYDDTDSNSETVMYHSDSNLFVLWHRPAGFEVFIIGNGISHHTYEDGASVDYRFLTTMIDNDNTIIYDDGSFTPKYMNFTVDDTFTIIKSQFINLIRSGKQFVITGVAVECKVLDTTDESYTLGLFSPSDSFSFSVTNNAVGGTDETVIHRHDTGSHPINGLYYSLTGTNIQINNIVVEGYYMEV